MEVSYVSPEELRGREERAREHREGVPAVTLDKDVFHIECHPNETEQIDELLEERQDLVDCASPDDLRWLAEVADIDQAIGELLVRALLRS